VKEMNEEELRAYVLGIASEVNYPRFDEAVREIVREELAKFKEGLLSELEKKLKRMVNEENS